MKKFSLLMLLFPLLAGALGAFAPYFDRASDNRASAIASFNLASANGPESRVCFTKPSRNASSLIVTWSMLIPYCFNPRVRPAIAASNAVTTCAGSA